MFFADQRFARPVSGVFYACCGAGASGVAADILITAYELSLEDHTAVAAARRRSPVTIL